MSTALMRSSSSSAPRGEPGPAARTGPQGNALGFYLFLAVNAALFVRPMDVVAELMNVEIYQYLILACLLVSLPDVLNYLQAEKLEGRPIDLCVFLMLPIIMLSALVNGRPAEMFDQGFFYFKVIVYYVLFMALVTTPGRLRAFCGWLAVFACVVVALSALDFARVIRLPRIKNELGEFSEEETSRMYGPGLFQDPNDLCALIVVGLILSLGRFANGHGPRQGAGGRSAGWAWLLPLAMFVYGFYMTRSRGGLLACLAGLGVTGVLRWGWQRALLVGALVVPPLVVGVVAVRNVDMGAQHDTGQTRVQLWNEGMVMFRANPLFGVGMNHYQDTAHFVAHNAYLHAFAELGFPGGVLFLTAAFLSVWGLMNLRQPAQGAGGQLVPRVLLDPVMSEEFPFVAGAVAAWAVGMFSLSLNYRVVTYTFFAMASMVLATARTSPPRPVPRFELSLWVKMTALGGAFIVGMFVLIRLLFRA